MKNPTADSGIEPATWEEIKLHKVAYTLQINVDAVSMLKRTCTVDCFPQPLRSNIVLGTECFIECV